MTTSQRFELIRLVRQTMGESHPVGKRVVELIRNGHDQLARVALRESIEGQKALIEMDEAPDEGEGPDMFAVDSATTEEDRADLDKYKMLLEALSD